MSETTLRGSRLALASLIAVALTAQLLIGLSQEAGLTVVRFFSFFTVLSNMAALVMLAMLARRPDRAEDHGFAVFRGAVTVYMSVTGVVYAVILAPSIADVAVPEPWIDWTIHVIGPLAVAADWLVHPPRAELDNRVLAWWLVYPAVYLAYSLIRGPIVDWYPYPFLDPANGGVVGVALWSLVVLVVILGFGYAYRWWAGRSATPVPASQ
ncbi:MAG TPA: Pr6Pr family membrane protein [Acidimicrobiia bacterium]|nr:Pr6Pr family membrane protein [Acidimicrobiia bacterium]